MTAVVGTSAPGYDLVLLAHVLAAAVALVAVGVAGGSALALRSALSREVPLSDALRRYYRPGTNWVGRSLFLVPVFGVALLAMSGGRWAFADTWVSFGMAAWLVVAMVAEAVLWPTDRQLQQVVAARAGAVAGEPAEEPGLSGDMVGRLCLRAGVAGLGLAVTLIAVAVLMVAKP